MADVDTHGVVQCSWCINDGVQALQCARSHHSGDWMHAVLSLLSGTLLASCVSAATQHRLLTAVAAAASLQAAVQ